MRTRAKVDSNQKEVVAALRSAGCSILHTHQLGHGAPDIIAGKLRTCPACGHTEPYNYLMELKSSPKERLTVAEATFAESWRGQVETVSSVEAALRLVGALT